VVRSDSGDVDSSINIGYKNLVTGRNIGNGVLFGCGEESRQKEASPCQTAQKEQGCFEIFRTVQIKEEYIKGQAARKM
jgi:hypothetical protein